MRWLVPVPRVARAMTTNMSGVTKENKKKIAAVKFMGINAVCKIASITSLPYVTEW
jgi:hypothetical protein